MTDSPLSTADSQGQSRFPCGECGASLVYKPGTASLACEYCGHVNAIAPGGAPVAEEDFLAQLARLEAGEATTERIRAKCDACAAEVDPPANVTAFACPFCGSDIVATAKSVRQIKPRAVLPFKVERPAALALFQKWLRSRWFAPNALRRFARVDHRLSGIYVPCWTYDSRTFSEYTGQRGDDYWDTETYTVQENGRTVTRTRQARRTRWTSVRGSVRNQFDDLLVLASGSLPKKYSERLEPWDLANLVPYSDAYLSGFQAESYQVDLAAGFETAKGLMEPKIRSTICADIGGDHQRIDSVRTRYFDITFKHILLPVWISSYRYRARVFRFLVNARTGEVQGERPYSWIKITVAVLGAAAIVAAIVFFATRGG
ncbi:MAG: hypothetical protein AMXMBFR47_09540 [Planctomycetota bacterium]